MGFTWKDPIVVEAYFTLQSEVPYQQKSTKISTYKVCRICYTWHMSFLFLTLLLLLCIYSSRWDTMFHSMKNDYTEFACAACSQKIMTLWICSVRLANHLPVLCIGFPRYVSPRYSPEKSWLKSPSPDVTHKPRKRLKNGTVISVRAWWNIRRCCQFITVGWGCLDCHFETYCFCCKTWESHGKYTWHMNSQKWWYGSVWTIL